MMVYPEMDGKSRKRILSPWSLLFAALAVVSAVMAMVLFATYIQLERSLPSVASLKNYHPPVVSRMYAADGSLINEFYIEKRYVRPLRSFPKHLVQAFLAAEDARFYEHGALDIPGILRAMVKNIQAGQIVQGGSTITQQVVKSLLLSPERTWTRKVKEALLAYRMDRSLSKDEILYLYLNQIYLGAGAYGVEAAARTYFGKHASDLSLEESAMLAGLPKAPSRYNPFADPSKARERQRYVLDRMVEAGFITREAALAAEKAPLNVRRDTVKEHLFNAFTEQVRRQMEKTYGHEMLYREGLSIYTTLDLAAQKFAEKAVNRGLRELDKRHGYRGPEGHVADPEAAAIWNRRKDTGRKPKKGDVLLGAILSCTSTSCRVLLAPGVEGSLNIRSTQWAHNFFRQRKRPFQRGDLIRVAVKAKTTDVSYLLTLEQEPLVEGALLAMDPKTGSVLCMVGGRDFRKSQFNRAVQAVRQPGSAFKPIVYAAALDKGYTAASVLIDSPVMEEDPSLEDLWKPSNYDRSFWGPIPLRDALIHSRNVVTIKLLNAIGIHYVVDYARRLGITSQLTPTLSLALGASGVTLWELTRAYAAFANAGYRIEPYLVERVLDRDGRVLATHEPILERVISPQTAYLITHILEGVILEGTGRRVRSLGRPAAGKTGTTNDLKDAWFLGYTPYTLAGVWVGYDDHRIPLGRKETGGRAAAPIWLYFMESWLKDKPVRPFTIPPGIVFAKMQSISVHHGVRHVKDIYAAFRKGTAPSAVAQVNQVKNPTSKASSLFKADF